MEASIPSAHTRYTGRWSETAPIRSMFMTELYSIGVSSPGSGPTICAGFADAAPGAAESSDTGADRNGKATGSEVRNDRKRLFSEGPASGASACRSCSRLRADANVRARGRLTGVEPWNGSSAAARGGEEIVTAAGLGAGLLEGELSGEPDKVKWRRGARRAAIVVGGGLSTSGTFAFDEGDTEALDDGGRSIDGGRSRMARAGKDLTRCHTELEARVS